MKLYAFTTPEIAKHVGYLKIGETNGSIDKRVDQECHELNVQKEIVWRDAVITERSHIDKMIHRYLVNQGFPIQQFDTTGQDTEWIKCNVTDIEKVFAAVKQQLYNEDKREKLSQKFYEELRNWYFWATEESKNPDYTLRIIIRLLLCFFLKEKGLIPVCLFDENYIKENLKENEYRYYKVIVQNLFFYSLNTPMNKRDELENKNLIKNYSNVKQQFHKNIPFFNGGLFTKHFDDDILLNDDYFFSAPRTRTIKELDGKFPVAGIIYILSQYKYTLDETDNSDFIDPEFIGKMFECLLSCIDADTKESRRKVTGSYYTPREIVNYMVDEALNAYLLHNNDLMQCKIFDPACGSGAFPCGVMNAILQRISANKKLTQSERYQKKLTILQNVIYGADIQPMAVQIAMLRLFLSLIQEIQPNPNDYNFGIESLPSLDYKFVTADTLLGIDCGGLFFNANQTLFNEILALKQDYFKAGNAEVREGLKKRIYLLEKDLADKSDSNDIRALCQWNHSETAHSPCFDSRWMFGVENFDIVIGNPPYGAKLTDEQKKYCRTFYKSAKTIKDKQKGSLDSFSLFIENGFNQVKENGYVNFIVPLSVISSEAMTALHKLLFDFCGQIKVSSFSDRPRQIFADGHRPISIFAFQKTNSKCTSILTTQLMRWFPQLSLQDLLDSLEFTESRKHYKYGCFARIGTKNESKILDKIYAAENVPLQTLLNQNGNPLYYRNADGGYYSLVLDHSTNSKYESEILFDKRFAKVVGTFLSSNLYFWHQKVYSDNYHLKRADIETFPIPLSKLSDNIIKELKDLYIRYQRDVERCAVTRNTAAYSETKIIKEYKLMKARHYAHLIDDIICPLYGLTDEERNFIKNYEITFRVNE
jgi:predicted RNA methylase